MNKTKLIIFFLGSILISFIVFKLLYVDVHELGGLKLHVGPENIKSKAAGFSEKLELNTGAGIPKAALKGNEELILFTGNKFGIKSGNDLLRDSLPGYYWKVSWSPAGESGIRINSQDKDDEVLSEYLNNLILNYDSRGQLIKFSRMKEDSVKASKISNEEALNIARDFIDEFSPVKKEFLIDSTELTNNNHASLPGSMSNKDFFLLTSEKSIDYENTRDFEFLWKGKTGLSELEKSIAVNISGNKVISYSLDYTIKDESADKHDTALFRILAKVIFYIFIFILLAVIAYKRIRAYEIGFRLAFILGSITAICVGLGIFLQVNTEFEWEMLIPLILGPLFLGAGVVLLWAASETVTREVWKEKFISIDLATKGYIFHSKVGEAVLSGIGWGLLTAAVSLIFFFIFETVFKTTFSLDLDEALQLYSSISPGFTILINNISVAVFFVGVFFAFIVSGLKRRIASFPTLLIVCGTIWGIANIGDTSPLYFAVIFEIIIGTIFVFIYVKTDILTSLFALISYYTIHSGFALFTVNNAEYAGSGYLIIGALIIVAGFAFASFFTKDKITEYDEITPAFEKNITERQRLQRELEIARYVQMSFLPKTTPSFPGLEVASHCIPAQEVGGDYYDFVSINNNMFGIIIGDVSGKGTQAAFYMTLTKGFLKALSRSSESPSVVLSRMNELFYENVERGTFISMIYGVFDNERKVFKLSRAGHNPVIVKNSPEKIEMLNPTGLALGLEKGVIFSKTIQEMEVPFAPGDVFIFYTDGFTEAMNKHKEEFGEERLAELVGKISHLSAAEILAHITKDVKEFIGKAHQHDDMTMVVVKVS